MESQDFYECIMSKDGKRIYYENGKRVKASSLPEPVRQTLVCRERREVSERTEQKQPTKSNYFLSLPYELQRETFQYFPMEDIQELTEQPPFRRVFRDPVYWSQRSGEPKEVYTRGISMGIDPRMQYVSMYKPDPLEAAVLLNDMGALRQFLSTVPKRDRNDALLEAYQYACHHGRFEMIQYLRDLVPKTSQRKCSLDAARGGQFDVLLYLEQFDSLSPVVWQRLNSKLIEDGNLELLKESYEHNPPDGASLLTDMRVAIRNEKIDIIDYLLSLEEFPREAKYAFEIALVYGKDNVAKHLIDNYEVY